MSNDFSKVSVCNMALGFLGESNFIQDYDESSTEASVCRRYYDLSRRSLLASFPWSFAGKVEQLAQLDLSDFSLPETFEYKYAYSLPSQCLRVRGVFAPARFSQDSAAYRSVCRADSLISLASSGASSVPFVFMTIDKTPCICCNAETASAVYTTDVEDVTLMSPAFVEAFAWRLAMNMSVPLAGGNLSTRQQLAQAAQSALLFAQTDDANEEMRSPVVWGTELLEARG